MLEYSRISMVVRGLLLLLAIVIAASTPVAGQGVVPGAARHNLADLISQSKQILLGRVVAVTDGLIDDNVPFTEITLSVSEALKGPVTREYQFRQFGKLGKRGTKGLEQFPGASAPGFPEWSEGETVLVFLSKPARLTGMQTTVGFVQGKLIRKNGRFQSESGIEGIFDNLVVEADDLTKEQVDMLQGGQSAVEAAPLIELLRRAVDENWVERGVIHRDR